MSWLRNIFITDANTGKTAGIDDDGRLAVTPHSHHNNGTIHMHVDGLTTGTTRYILVDISNTTDYPHTNTDFVHLEWFDIEVDGNTSANYTVNLGFLENVDATNGDRTIVKHWSGSRTVGQSIRALFDPIPNAPKMHSDYVTTHEVSLNDINYQTDVNMATTLDPTTADTPSGNGDVVLEIIVTAGTVDIAISASYHTH